MQKNDFFFRFFFYKSKNYRTFAPDFALCDFIGIPNSVEKVKFI